MTIKAFYLPRLAAEIHPAPNMTQEEQNELNEKLLDAIAQNEDVATIRALAEAGADVRLQNEEQQNLLHIAAKRKADDDVILFLMENGVDINARDDMGNTPLQYICKMIYGAEEIFLALVKAGADIHTRNNDGATLLHTATAANNSEILRLLLKQDMTEELEAENSEKHSPLRAALDMGISVCARLLIDAGANIHAENAEGETMLHAAAAGADSEMVLYLLRNGLKHKLNAETTHGGTPLHNACWARNSDACVRILLEAGADVNAGDGGNGAPLDSAVGGLGDKAGCVRLLLEAGANPNSTDSRGETPLIGAVQRDVYGQSGAYPIIHLLLEHGANVQAADENGKTALHWAENTPYLHKLLQEWAEKQGTKEQMP